MSPRFPVVKKYYEYGWVDEAYLTKCVQIGWITEEEKTLIMSS